MDETTKQQVDDIWDDLNIFSTQPDEQSKV